MKRSDKAALAVGAVGTWIYIGGVDSDLWGRAALGAGMFLLALVAKKIGRLHRRVPRGAGRVGRRAPGRSVCGVDPERITERIRKRRMKKERLTVKNPDGTYRIWMERAGTFRLESQMDSVFAYGDLVNKLGRYEDQDEEKHKK